MILWKYCLLGVKQQSLTHFNINANNTFKFSIFFLESPRNLNRSGNLTGSERKIKDGVADVYNLIQKWRSGYSAGMKIVDEIANIKLQHM